MDEWKKPLADKGTSLSGSAAVFGPQSAFRLILAMCAAEVLSMVGVFAFPALLPRFSREWGLSNTQAGWINGIYFAGYTATVPVLVSLTDRVDPRRIYLFFALVGTLASLGFALFAQGLWTALLFRLIGGLGLAGTFIPGLKALVDRLDGTSQARAVSFYTATFGIGTSLSFFAIGKINVMFGWRWAFILAVAAGVLALLLTKIALHPKPPQQKGVPETRLLDFRPVFRNRRAMAFILAYAAHMWELFAVRSWMVAFLTFSLSLQRTQEGYWNPPTIVALSALLAVGANVGAAELAIRFGRRRILNVIMIGSALLASSTGFSAALFYPAVAVLCVIYSLFVQGDSAALHMATVQNAEPDRRGSTLAVQSLLGFASASLGPLITGVVLDLTGSGQSVGSWGAAFITMGAVVAMGPVMLALLNRPASDDRK